MGPKECNCPADDTQELVVQGPRKIAYGVQHHGDDHNFTIVQTEAIHKLVSKDLELYDLVQEIFF